MRRWATLACACLFISGCQGPSDHEQGATALAPGHRKMLKVLKGIAERTPDENSYLGDFKARQLRERLANLTASVDDPARWNLHLQAGKAELRLGKVRDAIAHLSRAYQLLPKSQLTSSEANLTRFQLGLAYLRLGETQNCCLRHTPESCIMPIQAGGLHTQREGSQRAIHYFTEVLKNTSRYQYLHGTARWLLNIAYMTLGNYPDEVPNDVRMSPTIFTSEIDFPRFKNVAPKLGLATFSLCGGAIVDDFNNDGYLDIVTSTHDTTGQTRFFRNNQDGTFSDRTEQAGLLGLYGGLNCLQADYDNDGNLDILVLRGAWMGRAGRHPNSLLRNNGNGTFTDVTFEAGLGEVHYPTQTGAWGDYDNDGDLDLYIGNETSTDVTAQEMEAPGKTPGDTRGKPSPNVSAPCQLFRNNGDGTFTDVAAQAGVQNRRFTKGVVWGDFNADRFPDLYVSNMGEPNRLYRNNGDGTFTDVAPQLHVTRPQVSFPVWFWDFDNDGALDLFVSSYTGGVNILSAHHLGWPVKFETACLYRGDGRGGFTEVAKEQHLTYPMLPMGANFGDLNNDGYLDFYLGTGDSRFSSLVPNLMFLNLKGKGFANVTMAGGFGHLQKGHGIAFADLDHDGDCDVFEQMGGAYRGDAYGDALFENPGFGNHWITIKLVGVQSNRSAIGARIKITIVEDGRTRSILRHVNSGGSFGANPLRQTIGLGKAKAIRQLEVFWPRTGRTQIFRDVAFNQTIRITEGEDQYTQLNLRKLAFQ